MEMLGKDEREKEGIGKYVLDIKQKSQTLSDLA